jgi:phytanoyl-CoA hydroxylase
MSPSAIDSSSPSPPSFDVSKFTRDGYLVLPHFLPPSKISELRTRVTELLNSFSLQDHPMTKFSTGETEAHVGDEVSPYSALRELMTVFFDEWG